jgi:subtilase family serine protease
MIRTRKARWSAGIVLGAATLITPLAALSSPASAAQANPGFSSLVGSVNPTTDLITGGYNSPAMQVEVALTPRNEAGMNNLLDELYTQGSPQYHKWLADGVFNARYAPTLAAQHAVASYLTASGLTVEPSGSPFLIRAEGSSSMVSFAFRTTLSTYRDPHGTSYFANSTPVFLPTSIAGSSLGVIGLTNTVVEHQMLAKPTAGRFNQTRTPLETKKMSLGGNSSCETSYPTAQQLFAGSFPFGYGGGPGCSGLTPSQTNSIYGAPSVGPRGEGKGVNVGVFELSAYQHSDINTWAHQFYGPGYTPPLVDVNVDGGPLAPVCPVGDTCPPSFNGYAGDIEVDADIEASLAVSPDMNSLVVYNAPNDFTGQTELDEYAAIAQANQVSTLSSSWAVCENDVTASYVQAENVIFEKMASQGQSVFGAEGDTGAFSCIRSDGTTIVNVLDPPSQPWVTSVGGTSLESFNPGSNPRPGYPSTLGPFGSETVWNVDDLCSNQGPSASNDNQGGFFWCAATGAGGGGSSQWWGRPSWQRGPGVNNKYTTYGNGSTQCALAATGTPCREDPDVSMNADEYTPYAEYCTGNVNTPNSVCAGLGSIENVPGWFGIGGTSLSSPLWAAIIADRDSYQGHRTGNAAAMLYNLYNIDPGNYFHDITGLATNVNNNGLFPTTPFYDEATGMGTPRMAGLITQSG